MIHTFTDKGATYEVDSEKLFDIQNKEFKQFWAGASKISFEGYSYFENEEVIISVYDRGGVIIFEKESEVSND